MANARDFDGTSASAAHIGEANSSALVSVLDDPITATEAAALIADALGPGATLLASTDLGEGAALVGVHDSEGLLDATTAEAAFAELALSMGHSGISAATEIVGGVLTVTGLGSALRAEVEGAVAASDDLDTITGLGDGGFAFLTLTDAGRNVVVKHGTGNVSCPGGFDVTLDALGDVVGLFQMGATVNAFPWRLASLNGGGLGAALNSAANGQGASRIAIEDADGIITAASVEGAIAENRGAIDVLELAVPNAATGGIYTTPAPFNQAGVGTLTAAQVLDGVVYGAPVGGAVALTLPTAADLVAGFTAEKGSAAAIADSCQLSVINTTATGGETWEVTMGAGGTALAGNMTVGLMGAAQAQSGIFLIRLTNVTPAAEAYDVIRVS